MPVDLFHVLHVYRNSGKGTLYYNVTEVRDHVKPMRSVNAEAYVINLTCLYIILIYVFKGSIGVKFDRYEHTPMEYRSIRT